MWWIILLFHFVYADDDDWYAGDVDIPPTGNNVYAQSNPYAVKELMVATGTDANPAGYHQYKYIDPDEVDESLYRQCYYAGHGHPKKYSASADIWSSIHKNVKSIEPEEIWCSIPDKNFEVSSDVIKYNVDLKRLGEAVQITMEQQYAKPSTLDGVSNGWTFPVGDTNHIDNPIETFTQEEVYWNSNIIGFDSRYKTKMRAHFPYNRENARDTAVRKVKEALSVYKTSDFCSQWNIVAAGGLEYKEMPEYIQRIGFVFESMVMRAFGKYSVEIKLYNDKTEVYEWVELNHANVQSILDSIKRVSILGGNNIELRRHLWNLRWNYRLSCEDYGYEHLVDGECYDSGLKEYIEMHPQMYSDGTDLCRYRSEHAVYVWDAGGGDTSANAVRDYVRFGGESPIVITHRSEVPDTKLFCKKNHNLDPVQSDHRSVMSYKYSLQQIHNAHMAVMTWAHVNCKNGYGSSFTSSSDFSCLLGAHDITMQGPSYTIPLPFGFAAGWTVKNVAKGGLTFIVKRKYSFCVESQEKAKMQGPKVAWKPFVTAKSVEKAKGLLKDGASDVKSFRGALGRQMKKENYLRNPKNFIYNKKSRGWGPGTKMMISQAGKKQQKKDIKRTENLGIPVSFRAEYWMEEGSCSKGDCKLKPTVYSWDMIAASASFFTASAGVSYIRVYKTGHEQDIPDSGFLNSLGGNFINSGSLRFFQGESEGWDRYLLQLFAQLDLIPNLGQILNVAYGRPLGPKAKSSKSDWNKAKKKAKASPKAKFKLKDLLGEIVISMEKAHGQGQMYVLNSHGVHVSRNPDWYDYHGGNLAHLGDRITWSHQYWDNKHKKALLRRQPFQPLVSCSSPIDPIDPDTLLFNRFPINSKCNDAHPKYMPVLAPTREPQIRIPVTYKSYRIIHASRGLLVKKQSYNLLDIALSDDAKSHSKPATSESEPYVLLNEKFNYNHILDLSAIENLGNSYIHGLSDILKENAITMNPYAVTNADENTGELKVKKANYQFLTLENCDAFGLTPIRHITDNFNEFLGSIIFPDDDNWKSTINDDDFVETTNIDGTIEEEVIENIHASPIRPYGLIVSGRRDGKPLVYRQTERYLYGQQSETSGMITKHLDCREDYRCICLGPSDYAYIMYSILNDTHVGRQDLIMHPVDTYQECKIAQQHRQFSFDDTMFEDLSYYMNMLYQGPGVQVVQSARLGAGCILHKGNIVFNDHSDATFNPQVSLVKILKMKFVIRHYDYANQLDTSTDDYRYQRIISRKNKENINGVSVPDTVKANLEAAIENGYATRVSLEPKENHDIGQVQLIYQDNVLKYFPVGEEYEALKDTNAIHMIYGSKLHSWRFVDQYLKTNKQKVEKYTEASNLLRLLSYIDMKNNVWNDWNASVLPEGKAEYSFVKNLGSYVAATNEVVVPEVDFIADRKISFYGKNIPMEESDCAYCTQIQGVANVPHFASCEVSLMLPNRCPAGYGMDGDKVSGNETDVYGVPYKYGDKRQCALCPFVNTCKTQCTDGHTKDCLNCLSPEGHYRCQLDVTKCDKPGYVWVTTHRGGKKGHLTGHCVKTDIDPKEEDEWHTTNLQKEYWDRGEPFFPHRWEKDGTPYIRNEKSSTRYLTCDTGYVPVKDNQTPTHKCSNTEFTNMEDCEAETVNTWTGHCSNASYTSQESCEAVTVNTWTDTSYCSDPTHTSAWTCIPAGATWYNQGICDDGTDGFESDCLADKKYTWTPYCSNASYTSQETCEAETVNTWIALTCSGYICERCPPTYIEDNQICVKCGEREVAGYLLGKTGEEANTCQKVTVPVGHFFDSQNVNGVTVDNVNYPFISHCDHWLNHPAGAIGAYQDKENQLVCKTSNTTSTNFGEHAVLFKGGIVKFWNTPGRRVNSNRTAVVNCEDHQVCNGEEITGCKPGYIWKQQTPDTRDDDECSPCNNDTTILDNHEANSVHGERDNYEYCDGTQMFRCADASYTDAYELGFKPKIAGIHNDIFVGVREGWENSQLVHKDYSRFKFRNWNKIPFETQSSGGAFTVFKANAWAEPVQGDHKANWRSFTGKERKRGIEWYEYNSSFTVDSLRVKDNEKFNPGAKCYPVPDGYFALPDKWEKKGCGFSEELCVHRTFHDVIPYKPTCPGAKKHFLSNAVKEDCYDYIYRWEDRICTDGLLPGGCNKEYCTREGQSNCWCGDEEDFCTMGCVSGMCQEICGDRVCKEYELCYGEFNAIKSFAQCVIKCQEPKSNYCLWENEHGNTVYCRHFNTDWNSAIMQTLDPKPTGPCFDEMPNIPETQCQDPFDSECFCGRTFIDNTNQACVDKQVKGFCTVLQDDGTCTYETSNDGTCVCGDILVDKKIDDKCYATNGACGNQARTKQLCNAILGDEDLVFIQGCQPTGVEVDVERCAKANSITKEYVDIAQEPNLKCVGTEVAEIEGCVDPQGKNYNEFATIPKKCQY